MYRVVFKILLTSVQFGIVLLIFIRFFKNGSLNYAFYILKNQFDTLLIYT
jgi:hypothetical protein